MQTSESGQDGWGHNNEYIANLGNEEVEINPLSDYYICFNYHPSSGLPSQWFDSYPQSLDTNNSGSAFHEGPDEPWFPFLSQANFDFANFISWHHLSAAIVDELLLKLNGARSSSSLVTMQSTIHIKKYVKASVLDQSKFQKEVIQTSYRVADGWIVKEEHTIHIHDLLGWVTSLVQDPNLIDLFQWYPIQKYHVYGDKEFQFVDELCSGTNWWDEQ
ncbi:hypothetical protein FRB93_000767, partial [Tulasnella sp. JGI-2019a]